MTASDVFPLNSRERLPTGDVAARAGSALRLGDLQAAANRPRSAPYDGGEVRTLAIWDFYFIEEACRRLPRSQGIFHLHNGWPGLDTARFAPRGGHRAVRSRSDDATLGPSEVQAWVESELENTDPGWTIVATRLVHQLPDPDRFVDIALRSRQPGAGLVVTGMGGLSPYVYHSEQRLGLITPDKLSRWSNQVPILCATETNQISPQWPHDIIFGVAYD